MIAEKQPLHSRGFSGRDQKKVFASGFLKFPRVSQSDVSLLQDKLVVEKRDFMIVGRDKDAKSEIVPLKSERVVIKPTLKHISLRYHFIVSGRMVKAYAIIILKR